MSQQLTTDSIHGVKIESHQQHHSSRQLHRDPKPNTTGGDTIIIDVDGETNNNHHGSVDMDAMVIEVDMGTYCSGFRSESNIATQLQFGLISSIFDSV